jgi:hypothetical protein
MAEESYREIYLFKKWRVPPIDIVYGSALPITLKFLDYTIPANATIMVYASVDETTVYQQSATASGNAVQFTPGYGFFAVGLNKLQIAINGNKITLEILVNCQRFLAEGNDPTSTPEAVRPLVEEAREILKETKAVAVKTPYVGDNGNWYVWDTATGAFKDSGEPSRGATGPQGPQGDTGPQGPQGDTGTPATVTSTETVYQAGTSGTEAPTGTWSAAVPAVPQGQYLWTRVTTQFNTGSPVVYYSVSRFGVDGSGSVASVNGKDPDPTGNVRVQAENITTSGGQTVEEALAGKQAKINTSGLLKGTGNGLVSAAVHGVDYQLPVTSVQVTLPAAGWQNNAQTAAVSGVTADSAVVVSPAPSSFEGYNEAECRATAQGAGTITFSCGSTPSGALTVNVMIINK